MGDKPLLEINNNKLFEIVKPYISGMSLGEINDLFTKLQELTFDEFVQWVNERPRNKKLRVLLDIVYYDLKEEMK